MIKKIVIGNETLDVITQEEYERRQKLDEPLFKDTALEHDNYVYPITNRPDQSKVGVFDTAVITRFIKPITDEEKEMYSSKNIIDFDNAKNLADNIKKMDKIKMAESARLTTKNNILQLQINETDSPELAAIKEAINLKSIDAESYKDRFPSDSDFNNDMRLLKDNKNNNISFFKMKRVLDAFDIEATLTIKDKPKALNPINKTLKVRLTTEE
jgi:hypothetical protein